MKFRKELLFTLLIHSAQGDWIDVDTPDDKRTTTSFVDGTEYELVMSDEFNVPGRSFADGDDPTWTALDKSDDDADSNGGGSLHFYNSSQVETKDGKLIINSNIGRTDWVHYNTVKKEYKKVTKKFKSGMMQSWNKFCFTGGIVEIDMIFPGDPDIGGLWPAAWMLGNLGRSTYEASTNMIWPWSYNKCDRERQPTQAISKCNARNHFGMNKFQGRGSTEIDIIEVMSGDPDPLPSTDPVITQPYVDMTLQVAPGIEKDRPQSGSKPLKPKISESGRVESVGQVWYEGLEFYGNTSLNPFFYGTYLGPTKPEEPVQRTKKQAFQADAVGAMHQITEAHFKKMHKFRIEWQPGPGGRIDWFAQAYRTNGTSMDESIMGDGEGEDWVKAFSIKDESLNLTGAQIPNEPSYLILNTAISSTWGFPYTRPAGCERCFSCDDPKCACNFHNGFCSMLKKGVKFEIDSVRVYQSKNHSSHVGNPHTLGCDPPEYPTREFIKGYEYRYTRPLPFGVDDKGPLKKIQKGGGSCETDNDCGANGVISSQDESDSLESRRMSTNDSNSTSFKGGRGVCIPATEFYALESKNSGSVCKCEKGFTGPNCLAVDHIDESISAYYLLQGKSIFEHMRKPTVPPFFIAMVSSLLLMLMTTVILNVALKKKKNKLAASSFSERDTPNIRPGMKRPEFRASSGNPLVITGRSV